MLRAKESNLFRYVFISDLFLFSVERATECCLLQSVLQNLFEQNISTPFLFISWPALFS
jgi:hypothetical protein